MADSTDHKNKAAAAASSWKTDSQWLQTTLADLERKKKAMLNTIQDDDDGESFTKKAEMYFKKRPELVEMVEDLYNSYRSLAENYDKLRSESVAAAAASHPRLSSSSMNGLADRELIMSSDSSGENNSYRKDFSVDVDDQNLNKEGLDLEREKIQNELKLEVSKLVEDNLKEQAELVRRNDEKREAIRQLRAEINKLVNENRVLKVNSAKEQKQNLAASRFRKSSCIRFYY